MGISQFTPFKTGFCKSEWVPQFSTSLPSRWTILILPKFFPHCIKLEKVIQTRGKNLAEVEEPSIGETFLARPSVVPNEKSGHMHTLDKKLNAGDTPQKEGQMASGYSPNVPFSPKKRSLSIAQVEQLISSSTGAPVPIRIPPGKIPSTSSSSASLSSTSLFLGKIEYKIKNKSKSKTKKFPHLFKPFPKHC